MSASSRTLVIPELVASVLYFLRDDSNSLATCIRLNNLWAGECARLLWAVCSTAPFTNYGSRPRQQLLVPATGQLSELAKSGRLQWYARYIRHLSFVGQDSTNHPAFANISFPSLETLKLSQSWMLPDRYNLGLKAPRGSDVLQYLQPRLRHCQIHVTSLCSDFFVTLLKQCPLLQELEVVINGCPIDLSMDEMEISHPWINPDISLAKYLIATSCLKDISLHVWHPKPEIWTPRVFLALAQNQYLQSFKIPRIPKYWLSSLQEFSPGTLFRKISKISVSLSEAELLMLAPHISRVVDMDLCVHGTSLRLLRIAASVFTLSSLQLRFSRDVIGTVHSEDLVLLAENCPGLCLLHIYRNQDVTGVDVTDATIRQMARCLPKLTDIDLHLLGSTLSEDVLLSLGLHCRELKSCKIFGRVSYELLFEVDHVNLFPALETLDTNQRVALICPTDPCKVALRLRQAAPMLRRFHYYDDNRTFEIFYEFQKKIREAYSDTPGVIEIRPLSPEGTT